MKKIRLLFTLLLLAVIGTAQAESISVSDVSLTPGSQAELVINCEFSNDNITLYQFDLYLPEGVTPAYDESEEDYIYELSSRHKKSHQLALNDLGSFYRVVVSSNTNKLIAAGSGELLRITVNVASSVSGTQQASIRNFFMYETDETEHPMSDVTFKMIAPGATVLATGVTLNQGNLTLTSAGQTASLTATVSPSNATNKSVTWTSSNPSVATVSSSGVVTAVANGTATITATTADGSNKTATCAVTVNIPVKATGVSLNQTSLTLTSAGQTATLQATVSPSNASNKNVTWSSSNPSVATVSNGVVTAVANGTATITVTTADGSNKTATCAVTVNIQTVNPDNHYEQVPVQKVEYLQNSQIYTATTERASWYVPAGGSQLQTTKFPTSVEANPSNQGQQFAFINYEGDYYIYCVGEKKILNGITQNHYNRGELVINNCQPVSITETGDTEYPFFFSYGDSYNINVGGSNQITIDIWKTLDEGNKVAIQPVQGATLTQSELNTIIGYIVGDTIDENNTNVTNGYISYIGDSITSVNSIQANSYYLLTSVGRHGSDGQYLYESNAPDLCFEKVTVGHDINAAFQFEPVGDNQFRIKTISGNYIPTPKKTGWFIVSSDNPATLLIEPIKGVDDQFTLSCVGTGYYLDADELTASMWHTKGHANGNGAYRIVYCEIERTTAIDNVIGNSAVNTDQSVYTIQGQRVTNTRNLRPGIYIIGGKKVLIK